MLKRIATYTTIALALCACSDEDFTLPNGVGEDGSLDIRIAVPEMQTVTTRAGVDENAVNSITMLVISESKVAQVANYSGSDISPVGTNEYSLSVKLNPSIRSKSDLKFYFIANSSATFAKDEAESVVKQMTYTDVIYSDGSMTMSGTADLVSLTSGTSAPLYRNAAKVSVSAGREVASETDPDQTEIEILSSYHFSVFGTAAKASVVAGTSKDLAGDPTAATLTTEVGTDPAAYIHPTKASSGTLRPYVVLKAPYNGADYYYRVDFRNKAEDGSIQDLDLESNHWYKIVVTAINGAGSATVAEAAQNPSPLVEATIYDVVPESYNMVTDGIRELGVSHELLYEGMPGGTQDIYVKLYSPNVSEYPEPTVDAWKSRSEKLVSTTYRWLTLAAVEDVTATFTDNTTTKGKVYKLSVKFNATETPGTLNALINVDWQGLHREIPVTWKREFTGASLCSVALTITNGDGVTAKTYDDYWTFLKDNVNGVTAEQNGGNIRNEGLHFPVMYGDVGFDANGNPTYKTWTYSYQVTYNADVIKNAEWKLSSDLPEVKLSATSGTGNGSTLTVDVTWIGDSWDYKTGILLLEVANADGGWTKYPLDVYHTGFFHDHTAKGISEEGKSTSDYRVGGQPVANKPIYYYEVLESPSGNHWLDRNLGATASGLYIATSSGADYYGNPAAAGGYYRAAGYNEERGDPKMYEGLCPPGYEVPREETWNSVRNSTWFSTSQSGSYYDASMRCTNGMRIYFPKVGYYAETTRTGESRAGYYWSSTAASGLEKDQIGNWLRCLQFSGSVTTLINGQVQGRSSANGYAMSVRCVGKTPESKDTYRTDFNVSGATHVYIYSENANGSRNIVYPWPGKAIGNYSTVKTDGSTMMNFSYESKTTPADKFYVIFSYKDSTGKIHTVSKTADGNTLYSTNQNPANLNGWRVVGDETVSGTLTATGGTWKVTNPTSPDANPTVYFNDSPFTRVEVGKKTIYCWNLEGWDNVVALCQYKQGGGNITVGVAGEKLHSYYPQLYKFEVPDESQLSICFSKINDPKIFGTAQCSPKFSSVIANRYYSNCDANSNKILPSEIKEPAGSMRRIAIRKLSWSGKYYIYDWGSDYSTSGPASKEMTSLMDGKYYYYDISNSATGFLFTNGKWKSDGGIQTDDITGESLNKYKEGKLVQDWFGPITIKN